MATPLFPMSACLRIIAIDEYVHIHIIEQRGVGALSDGHTCRTDFHRFLGDRVIGINHQGFGDGLGTITELF